MVQTRGGASGKGGGKKPAGRGGVVKTAGGKNSTGRGGKNVAGGRGAKPTVVAVPGTSRQQSLRSGKKPISQNPVANEAREEDVAQEGLRQEELRQDVSLFINETAEERYSTFGKRRLCKTKVFHPDSLIEMRFDSLMKYFKPSHLDRLLTLCKPAYLEECIQFYSNLGVDGNKQEIKTKVRGVEFVVSKWTINEVLGCPWVSSETMTALPEGGPYEFEFQNVFPAYNPSSQPIHPARMGRKYFKRRSMVVGKAKEYKIANLTKEQRVVFELVCENCYPTGGHASEPKIHDLMLFYYLMEGKKINPGYTILWYMLRATKYKGSELPYGGLVTALIEKAGVKPLGRALPLEYYGDSWLIHKGLEIKNDGTVGSREPISSKKSEKLRPGEF